VDAWIDFASLVLVELRQDLGDGPLRDRIDGCRGDFRERFEDEPTRGESWMRDAQLGVSIIWCRRATSRGQGPLAPVDRPCSAEPRFDLLRI